MRELLGRAERAEAETVVVRVTDGQAAVFVRFQAGAAARVPLESGVGMELLSRSPNTVGILAFAAIPAFLLAVGLMRS